MDVFDLAAKIRLDTTEYDKGLGEAERQTNSFASRIGSGLASLGKTIGAAMAGAATALGVGATALTKQATSSYAQYEQLVGGVETLFQTSSDKIMEYADKAYATAGLSANEYMQTVTSFAASLVQSAGRGEQQDTEMLEAELEGQLKATKRALSDEYDAVKENWDKRVKAAKNNEEKDILRAQRDSELKALKRANEDKLDEMEAYNKKRVEEVKASNSASVTTEESLERAAKLANMAIIDMSDNANKMGTSMESIQNAYQGFAKQNYTMLDNLKLGYGGTKGEMERLLRDAEKISGIKYNVASYADIVEAIHLIQTQMGISGLTAEDAAEMVANGVMTQEEAYEKLGTTAKEAEGTIEGSAKAVRASWNNIITGLANGDADIGKLVDVFIANVEKSAENLLPTIERAVNGVITFAESFIEKAPALINKFLPTFTNAITSLTKSVTKALPVLIKGGGMLISALIDGVLDNFGEILDAAGEIVSYLGDAFINVMPRILDVGATILEKVVQGISNALPKLMTAASALVVKLSQSIQKNLPTIIQAGRELLKGVLTALTDTRNMETIVKTAITVVTDIANALVKEIPKIISAISKALPTIISGLTSIITMIVQSLPTILSTFVKAVPQIITIVFDAISKNLPEIINSLIVIVESIINEAPKILQAVIDNADKIISAVVTGITNNLDDLVDGAVKIITSLAGFVVENAGTLAAKAVDLISALVNAFVEERVLTKFLSGAVTIITELVAAIIKSLPDMAVSLAKAAKAILTSIWDGFKSLGTYFAKVGKYVIDKILVNLGLESAEDFGKKYGEDFMRGIGVGVDSGKLKTADNIKSENALRRRYGLFENNQFDMLKWAGLIPEDAELATSAQVAAGHYYTYTDKSGQEWAIYDESKAKAYKSHQREKNIVPYSYGGGRGTYSEPLPPRERVPYIPVWDTEGNLLNEDTSVSNTIIMTVDKQVFGKVTYTQQKNANAIIGKELVNVGLRY